MCYLLTPYRFTTQEQLLVDLIVKTVAPEKVFYLGATLTQRKTESLFVSTMPAYQYPEQYFFLVLMAGCDSYACSGIQDKVENHCRQLMSVTALVLEADRFNDWLRQGHPFAHTIGQKAPLLYDAGLVPLADPGPLDQEKWNRQQRDLYKLGHTIVQEFLAGADLFMVRRQYKMAAFMLHQATEQALSTLFRMGTGLRLSTHNLDKLLRYCSLVNYRVPFLFPRDKGKNKHYFGLLQRAYIEPRYKEHYNIGQQEAEYLMGRVKLLQGLLEEERGD